MKIYKAELILCYTEKEKYETIFSFELAKDEYKQNEKFREWVCHDGWLSRNIPMDLTIDRTLTGSLKVVQGFDYKLDDSEVLKLKERMKKFMKKQLILERENYLKNFEMKFRALLK